MKILFVISFLILISVPVVAQKNLFSIGVNLDVPQDVISHSAATGWGCIVAV
jgi:hypothetical protein